MKKSLIALALVGAFASAAQAAESNYSIYGRLDLGIVKSNVKGDDSVQLNNGTQSRLGFKGVEDLGNGLKGKFQIEHRFNTDDGTTRENDEKTVNGADRFWRGQAWVGFAGEFGEVRLGRQYDALANTSDQVDPFGGDYVLTKRTLQNSTTGVYSSPKYVSEGLGFGAPASRRDNSVVYMTPNMSGFSAEAHLMFAEKNYKKSGSTSKYEGDKVRNLFGVRLAYENGPIAASLAYQQTGDTDAAKAAGGKYGDGDEFLLYAGYTLNNATTFGFGYYNAQADSVDKAVATGQDDSDVKLYTLSVTHKIGQGKILAGYQWGTDAEVGLTSTTTLNGKKYSYADSKYSKFAIGYHHSLSDRTTLYVNVANEKVKNAGYSDASFLDGVDADSVNVFGFGVKHNF